jgi:hypothetical protein
VFKLTVMLCYRQPLAGTRVFAAWRPILELWHAGAAAAPWPAVKRTASTQVTVASEMFAPRHDNLTAMHHVFRSTMQTHGQDDAAFRLQPRLLILQESRCKLLQHRMRLRMATVVVQYAGAVGRVNDPFCASALLLFMGKPWATDVAVSVPAASGGTRWSLGKYCLSAAAWPGFQLNPSFQA